MSTRRRPHRIPTRRKLAAVLAVCAVTSAGLAAGPATAAAKTPRGATKAEVISGDARFEILSPTLIRTEYAGDAKFVDAPTFNAIGRDAFGTAAFTHRIAHGWLSITTAALTLKYRVGSGPFTPDNLTLTRRDGRQTVTAGPWPMPPQPPSCSIGQLCEAENLTRTGSGLSVASDHAGYTGSGFAAGFSDVGDALSFDVDVATAGTYDFDARYANSQGGDGQNKTRTLSLAVDDGAAQTVSFPVTGSWDTWQIAKASLTLPAGKHTVTLSRPAADDGNINVDSLALVTPGADYPAPAPPPVLNCAFASVCEAENGALAGGASRQSDHNDYSGAGFVGGLTAPTATVTQTVTGVPVDGTYQLQLRYANWLSDTTATGAASPRDVSVQVGSSPPSTTSLPATSSWDSWRIISVPVRLSAGTDTLTLGCPGADSCHVNLDTVALTRSGGPLLAPHAALGGYRRSLDGQNGSVVTTPGLLYQDGWTLLDDTPSAIFNAHTHTVTPRPSHGGKPYQDGYVFGYGSDYQQGLRDLATLTGPSELLPRWAYGVWYSEYYDHTAADYENTILPKFRSDGVPLDVLVTDTDFKANDTWNGWEMDPAKFPDPSAYFAWAHSQGLHTTLNVHPSIDATDPQYAQAQATANDALTQCGSAFCFDWGRPDQLTAYLDLHQQIQQQGNDFWWLDWCCDDSTSSLAGVTPDAWINQNYAWDTDATVGRGFAFSRAYSSLTAAGYSGSMALPTGPWADKRTTVHFTGDTGSSWAMLAAEVGYTPSESAATGLSAVSDDIGGFNNVGNQTTGSEPGSTKLPDDLYARWVQFGTFQPILRLHGNHSDRLPWQYGPAADSAAEKFLNLREDLVPYTYSLAQQATTSGVPVVRPTYLEYPDQQDAYANAGSEYFYGPDVLVAPVTTSGTTSTTSVWFPPGNTWTDYFTGKTYPGGTTQNITTDLSTMPVFLKSGTIVATRTDDVANDDQNPLTEVTLDVAEGAAGSFSLYEDNGTTTNSSRSATTKITYAGDRKHHTLVVNPAKGTFSGQVTRRTWTVAFHNATAPTAVRINGVRVPAASWTWDATTATLTVRTPEQSVRRELTVAYS